MTGTKARREPKAQHRCVLLVLLVLFLLSVAPATAYADDPAPNHMESITYIDAEGNEQTDKFWVMRSPQDWRLYQSYIDHFVAFAGEWELDALPFVSNTEKLVLMDGCRVKTSSVTIPGRSNTTDAAFSIYGQKEGTGVLEVTKKGADESYVAFNAFSDNESPTPTPRLSLHGGTISITTDGGTALKVSRDSDGAGLLEVATGTLTATSSDVYGVDVGSRFLVTGGTLEATGGQAGILSRGETHIQGGTITATATGPTGAGLLARAELLVEGGTVDATGPGGGIYMDECSEGGGTIEIFGGTVTGTCTGVGDPSAHDGPGIGGNVERGMFLLCQDSTVSGTSVNGAGIGGSDGGNGDIVIDILRASVTGTSVTGAGIGTGRNATGIAHNVTITSGTITASSRSGAGIGGGDGSIACPVTIKGGTIERAESMTGAGIGGGFGGDGGTVTIEGGTVHAYASKDSSGFDSAGAAIGGGSACTGYEVLIGGSDTVVTASAESGAGIGCGDSGSAGSVTITDGTVYATSNGTGACIGGAYYSGDCTVSISGGKVFAGLYEGGGQTDGAGIGGGEYGDGGSITISGGEVYARSAKGGAGIGGGYGGAGGTVSLEGGTVVAWSQQDGDGQAIGHGQSGGGTDTIVIGYDAAVAAGADESQATYATVSATSDGRVDACRQYWAKIHPCDHQGADTYRVISPDHLAYEVHCARCAALLEAQEHRFVIEEVEGDPSSARVWCTHSSDCPYREEFASTMAIGANDTTYDAEAHGARVEVTGTVPEDVVAWSIGYAPAGGEPGPDATTAPADAGSYEAFALVRPLGSNDIARISTTYGIAARPVLVRPSDQTVLRGRAIRQGTAYAALFAVAGEDPSGAIAGHVLSSVALAPTEALTESCAIEASDARIADALGTDVTSNYDLRYQTAQATVMDTVPDYMAPHPLLGIVYDGTEQVLVEPGSSDEATIEYAFAETGPYGPELPVAKDAGTYTVWWRVERTDDAAANAIPAQSLTAGIAPRRADLAWAHTEWWYDGRTHAPTATVANLAAGDSCAVVVEGGQSAIGTYEATAARLDNENYLLPSDATTSFVIKLSDATIPSEVKLGSGAPKVASSNLSKVAQMLASDEERGLAANGVDVRIWVQVDRMAEKDLSAKQRAALASRLKALGATAGWYLDIRVYKRVGDEVTRIGETPEPLRLAVTVPGQLRRSGRTHYLIREHDDKTDVLATTKGTTLEGQSDRFSPYLLAYQDAPSPKPDDPSSPSKDSGSSTVLPQTGDVTSGAMGLASAALALLACGLALRAE